MTDAFRPLADLINVAPDLVKYLVIIPGMLMFSGVIYFKTGSLFLCTLANVIISAILAATELLPIWICILFGAINGMYFLYNLTFFGGRNSKSITTYGKDTWDVINNKELGVLNVPNQITQKKHDENKNQCPSCTKKDICVDYKVLKYADDCDMYTFQRQETKKPIEIKVSVDLETHIAKELKDIKFDKGTRTLTNLKSEIEEVKNIFANSKVLNDKFIDIDKTKHISEEIYNKALNFLSLAIDIYKQTNTNCDGLKQETDELLESLSKNNNPNSSTYRILKSAIDSNNKVLELVKKNKDKIDELFGQISLCRDAIMEIRLNLPELINHQSEDEVKELIAKNKSNMEFGDRLLAEFKREGL